MVWPNHKPLQLLRMRACFKDFPKLFSMRLKSRLFFYLHNTVEDVSYGCHKISVQSLIQYIFILLSSFLPIQSGPAHISYLYKAGVLISIAPQSSSHLSARDMEPMAVTYEAAAPSAPLPLSKRDEKYLFWQKRFVFAKRNTYIDK